MMADDEIDWVSGKPKEAVAAHLRWLAAIEAADAGDLTPVIELLCSDVPFGRQARLYLADLLNRHRLRRDRRRTPAYTIPPAEARLRRLRKLVKYHRRTGMPLADAAMQALVDEKRETDPHVVEDWLSDEEIKERLSDDEITTLENFVLGRRGSSNRMRRFRP